VIEVALATGGSGVEELAPGRDVMERLGWSRLEARWGDVAHLLPPLLEELRAESCVHVWRQRLPRNGRVDAAAARRLLDAEESHRPTTAFVYVAWLPDGRHEVVASGAMSDRVRADFPYEGYPVLARCYIRPRWRGQGLYRVFLRHRFGFCRERWGDDLSAIHLGSAEEVVWKVAMEPGAFDPPFVHIGEEDLEVAGRFHRVRDLLAFAPGWVARLHTSVARCGDGPEAMALREHLAGLVVRGLPPYGFVALREMVARVADEIGRDPREVSDGLRGLMALGDAIPIAR
jgi:GNAT superfamily N-acetyltransferase